MRYVKLGRTGLKVSRFILGSMQMGWIIGEEESHKILDAALDVGLNTIDTADIYSKWGDNSYAGKSEEIIGKWIKDRGSRDDIVLATKLRGDVSDKPNDVGLSRKHVLESARRSCSRLNTDFIDLYWSHFPDSDTPQEETLRAFTKLIDDGIVHYIGASNHTGVDLVESLWASDRYNLARYDAIQNPYSLARRRDFEKDLLPVVTKYGFGVTSYSPLGGGFLTGRYAKDKTPDSKRAESTKTRYFKERNFKTVEVLERLAAEKDMSPVQVALAWVLSKESITAPIIGINSVEQLEHNLTALEIKLSEDDLKQLDDVSDWSEMDFEAR